MNDGVMEETNSVTPGCIQRIYNLEAGKEYALGVIVQVVDMKVMTLADPDGGGPPRFRHPPRRERYVARCPHSPLFIDRRLVLSDGEHRLLAVLDPALNDTVDIENLKPNTLVRLDEVICNVVQDRR